MVNKTQECTSSEAQVRAALKLAIEAMEWEIGGEPLPTLMVKAVKACKDALASQSENPAIGSEAIIKDLQQRLAKKDFEIMRLREALEWIDRDYGTIGIHSIASEALSTPATYDDLMAWHEAQLGEPVAWMSVDDRLPEFDTYILVFNGYQIVAEYSRNEFFRSGDNCVYGVTHWMPLPNPPKAISEKG